MLVSTKHANALHGARAITLNLRSREYPNGNADIIKLQAENRALQRRLSNMIGRIEKLEMEMGRTTKTVNGLVFIHWPGEVDKFTMLMSAARKDVPIPGWDILFHEDIDMWNILIKRRADRLTWNNNHILACALDGNYDWPVVYPKMIDKL